MVNKLFCSLLLILGVSCATSQWVVDTAVPAVTALPGFAEAVKSDVVLAADFAFDQVPYVGGLLSDAFRKAMGVE